MTCEGEFYSVPPDDHVARYEWAIKRLEARTRFDNSIFDVGRNPQAPVVDIGCGAGYGLQMLEEADYRAIGLDRNPMALEFCTSKGVTAYAGEYPCGLWVPREQWLAVLLFEVVEHNDQGMAMLAQAMKDAEIVLASVPYNEPPGINAFHKLHGLTEESFKWMQPAPTFHRLTECPASLLIDWQRLKA